MEAENAEVLEEPAVERKEPVVPPVEPVAKRRARLKVIEAPIEPAPAEVPVEGREADQGSKADQKEPQRDPARDCYESKRLALGRAYHAQPEHWFNLVSRLT